MVRLARKSYINSSVDPANIKQILFKCSLTKKSEDVENI